MMLFGYFKKQKLGFGGEGTQNLKQQSCVVYLLLYLPCTAKAFHVYCNDFMLPPSKVNFRQAEFI